MQRDMIQKFVWWFGVVEDRNDPLALGRCRVRILNWHNPLLSEIPSELLPWAYPMLPVNSAVQNGFGSGVTGPVEGTWVFGFFADGEIAQQPIMMGAFGGFNLASESPNVLNMFGGLEDQSHANTAPTLAGFKDVRNMGAFSGSHSTPGKPLKREIKPNVAGVVITENTNKSAYPLPELMNEQDTNRLERGVVEGTVAAEKLQNITVGQTDIEGAAYASGNNGHTEDRAVSTVVFSEPPTKYAPKYPYNHVKETESGHIEEFDDTPGVERIHRWHRTGTFQEIHPDGTEVSKVVGSRFTAVLENDELHVSGNALNTTDGGLRIHMNTSGGSNNHFVLHVGAGADCSVYVEKGDLNLHVANGNMNRTVNGSVIDYIAGDYTQIVKGGKTVQIGGVSKHLVAGDSVDKTLGTSTIYCAKNIAVETPAQIKATALDFLGNISGKLNIQCGVLEVIVNGAASIRSLFGKLQLGSNMLLELLGFGALKMFSEGAMNILGKDSMNIKAKNTINIKADDVNIPSS